MLKKFIIVHLAACVLFSVVLCAQRTQAMNGPGLSAGTKSGTGRIVINSRPLSDNILWGKTQPIPEKILKDDTPPTLIFPKPCDTKVHDWEVIQKDHPLADLQKNHLSAEMKKFGQRPKLKRPIIRCRELIWEK